MKDVICDNIFALLDESGIAQNKFAQKIGVAPQVVTDWKACRNKSYMKYLDVIAKIFNVNIEYLLSDNKNASGIAKGVDAPVIEKMSESELKTILDNMLDEDIDSLLDYARYLKWRRTQVL